MQADLKGEFINFLFKTQLAFKGQFHLKEFRGGYTLKFSD